MTQLHTAPDATPLPPEPCPECVRLEAGGRDLTDPARSACLYALVAHHIDEHAAQGTSYPHACRDCAKWDGDDQRIPSNVHDPWRQRHHVEHQLSIVWDGEGYPLRFTDMPRGPKPQDLRRFQRP